jgi:hypothetical protein
MQVPALGMTFSDTQLLTGASVLQHQKTCKEIDEMNFDEDEEQPNQAEGQNSQQPGLNDRNINHQ